MKEYVVKIIDDYGNEMGSQSSVGSNACEALEQAFESGLSAPAGVLFRAVVINNQGIGIEFKVGLNT